MYQFVVLVPYKEMVAYATVAKTGTNTGAGQPLTFRLIDLSTLPRRYTHTCHPHSGLLARRRKPVPCATRSLSQPMAATLTSPMLALALGTGTASSES